MCEHFCSSFAFFSVLSQTPPRLCLPLLNSTLCVHKPPPHLLSSPTSSLSSAPTFSPPLPFLPLLTRASLPHFISFHHPSEQKCMEEIPQAWLSITRSLNVRTRSLLLQKAHHTLMPHNADLRTRCSGNVAECVVINCAEIYDLHKVLSMLFYVCSLAEVYKWLCSFWIAWCPWALSLWLLRVPWWPNVLN